MRKLAYIVTERNVRQLNDCVERIDPSLFDTRDVSRPTLIVGWNLAKELLGDQYNILENKVSDTLYWTFGKMEKRTVYERVNREFYKAIVRNTCERVPYRSLSLFKLRYSSFKRMAEDFHNGGQCLFFDSKTIFVYDGRLIYGISSEELDYIGLGYDKVERFVRSTFPEANIMLDDSTVPYGVKALFRGSRYIFPYIMSSEK